MKLVLILAVISVANCAPMKEEMKVEMKDRLEDRLEDRMDKMRERQDMMQDRMKDMLQEMTGLHDGDMCPKMPPPKVWTFGVGRDGRPLEFFDPSTGSMHGFGIDLVRAACDYMDMKCEFIGYKDYHQCWNNKLEIAEGLNSHYFDACVNWHDTIPRQLSYDFSIPYAKEIAVFLYTRKGNNIDPNTLKNEHSYKISFRKGWRTDPICLEKNGMSAREENVVIHENYEEQTQALRNGEVDIAFLAYDDEEFARVGGKQYCASSGLGVMTRKETPLLGWLNKGIKHVLDSDMYTHMCYIAEKAYGGDPHCFKGKR